MPLEAKREGIGSLGAETTTVKSQYMSAGNRILVPGRAASTLNGCTASPAPSSTMSVRLNRALVLGAYIILTTNNSLNINIFGLLVIWEDF